MIKIYYDGKCGLCSREIEYYRKKDRDSRIVWVDVTRDVNELESINMSKVTALKHMHAKLEDGTLVRGIDAFIAIWKRIPGWQGVARVAQFPPLKILLDIGYEVFAFVRFRTYRHCRLAKQSS